MAKGTRVTQREKQKMWQLYNELGSFTKVAKKMNRGVGTVSLYVHEYEAAVHAAGIVLEAKQKGCEKMKRAIVVLLVLVMPISLCACKSDAVKAAEEAISAIGEVTFDSGDTIAAAEKLFGILTDAEKADVENRLALVDAREAFDSLQGEVVYANAKDAYEKLKEVAELCVTGMDAIYGAWFFGIYNADDASSSSFYSKMSEDVPGFTSYELQSAGDALGVSVYTAKSDWRYCLWIVEAAIEERGDYDTITTNMADAEKVLQSLTEEYDDYTYYPKLKDYYAAIKSYVEFFTSPSGSFKQLADTINSYENGIRTLESDVSFLFNK